MVRGRADRGLSEGHRSRPSAGSDSVPVKRKAEGFRQRKAALAACGSRRGGYDPGSGRPRARAGEGRSKTGREIRSTNRFGPASGSGDQRVRSPSSVEMHWSESKRVPTIRIIRIPVAGGANLMRQSGQNVVRSLSLGMRMATRKEPGPETLRSRTVRRQVRGRSGYRQFGPRWRRGIRRPGRTS